MGLYFRYFKHRSSFRQIFSLAARPIDKKNPTKDNISQNDALLKTFAPSKT
jgi:hypothetical protein